MLVTIFIHICIYIYKDIFIYYILNNYKNCAVPSAIVVVAVGEWRLPSLSHPHDYSMHFCWRLFTQRAPPTESTMRVQQNVCMMFVVGAFRVMLFWLPLVRETLFYSLCHPHTSHFHAVVGACLLVILSLALSLSLRRSLRTCAIVTVNRIETERVQCVRFVVAAVRI